MGVTPSSQGLPGGPCRADSRGAGILSVVDARTAGDLLDSGATGYHSDDFTPGPKASQGKSMLAQNPRTLEGDGIAKLMSPRSPFYSRGQRPGLIEQPSQAASTRVLPEYRVLCSPQDCGQSLQAPGALESNREDQRPHLTQFPKSLESSAQPGSFKHPFISLKCCCNHKVSLTEDERLSKHE